MGPTHVTWIQKAGKDCLLWRELRAFMGIFLLAFFLFPPPTPPFLNPIYQTETTLIDVYRKYSSSFRLRKSHKGLETIW